MAYTNPRRHEGPPHSTSCRILGKRAVLSQVVTPGVRNLASFHGRTTEKAGARNLGSCPATMHSHMERIYRKLGIGSRSALVRALFRVYLEAQEE